MNLLSVNRITEDDLYDVNFRRDYVDIYEVETNEIIFSALQYDKMKYVIFISAIKLDFVRALPATVNSLNSDTVLSEKKKALLLMCHCRLGHCSAKYLREAMKKSKGTPLLKFSDDVFKDCMVCAEAKAKKSSRTKKQKPPTRKFEIISSDVLNPECVAYDGKKLIVTFTDRFSGTVRFISITAKSEVPTMFPRYHKKLTNRFPEFPVAELQCNNAPEYMKGEMELYCNQTGIDINSGCPYTPELHGTSERILLKEHVRS